MSKVKDKSSHSFKIMKSTHFLLTVHYSIAFTIFYLCINDNILL